MNKQTLNKTRAEPKRTRAWAFLFRLQARALPTEDQPLYKLCNHNRVLGLALDANCVLVHLGSQPAVALCRHGARPTGGVIAPPRTVAYSGHTLPLKLSYLLLQQ